MEIPGFVEEWEKAGKEGTKMKLIWNELLHANFRCGRMGRRIHRDLYDALLCTNVYADGALNKSKRK